MQDLAFLTPHSAVHHTSRSAVQPPFPRQYEGKQQVQPRVLRRFVPGPSPSSSCLPSRAPPRPLRPPSPRGPGPAVATVGGPGRGP
eukprot:2099014-Rhodomonas_salina.3